MSGLLDNLGSELSGKCDVSKCTNDGVEEVTVKPLDPIDRDETRLFVCETHREWAAERNAFAEEIYEELRAYRKELGQEYIEEVQRLAKPEDWTAKSELMGGETIVVGDDE